MIFGKLANDGSLTDIGFRQSITWADGSTDVLLSAMPSEVGKFQYDVVKKLAVLLPRIVDEKMDDFGDRLAVVNTLKNSASWASLTAAQKAKVQKIIDDAAVKILAAIGL